LLALAFSSTFFFKKRRPVETIRTHASPEGHEELAGSLAKFRDAGAGATLIGMFDCQGELAKGVKLAMSIHPDPKVRLWAKIDDSQGQPDATRLERARGFARDMIESVSQTNQGENYGY
jgi:hypothetical protein